MQERYLSYSKYIKKTFEQRVQKVSIDTGFSCPNRDGSKARGGCTYCDNKTFNPFYCSPEKTITQQLNEGIAFFEPKYKTQKYLAYFQAYSNTYSNLDLLKKKYNEALSHPKVVGMVVSTRPDCINSETINLLNSYTKDKYVSLELGIESTLDKTLEKINRAHSYAETIAAYELTKSTNLHIGGHLILGLPNETNDDIINHASEISKLNINSLKLHQLQIIKGTEMAVDYVKNPKEYNLFTLENYIETVVKFIEHLRPDIILERFSSESPRDMLIAPFWGGVKNFEIVDKIKKRLNELDTFQGRLWADN